MPALDFQTIKILPVKVRQAGIQQGKIKNASGVSLLETPLVLMVIFVFLLIPMISLASITMRLSLVSSAVKDAVNVAAKSRTFETNTATEKCAVELAQESINRSLGTMNGVRIREVQTHILATNSTTGAITRNEGRLRTPADARQFVYQIETRVKGEIDPVIGSGGGLLGGIPGLTAPIPIDIAAVEMAEFPQGLNR